MRPIAECVVTADRNQTIDAEEVEILQHVIGNVVGVVLILVSQMGRHERLWQRARARPRAVQKRAAGPSCFVDDLFGQDPHVLAIVRVLVRDDIDQTTPAPANADDAMTLPQCTNRNGPDGRVEAGYVAAACQNPNCRFHPATLAHAGG